MPLKKYQEICKKTAKEFNSDKERIMTWGLGIAGEAGDVASCIKKTFQHDNDQTHGIKENIGDTLWYAAMICNHFGWNMQEVLEENIQKLEKRYEKKFSLEKAKRKGTMIDWNED